MSSMIPGKKSVADVQESVQYGVSNYEGKLDEMSSTINQLLVKPGLRGSGEISCFLFLSYF